MESLSKQELISNITKQSDQIKRYEARLRDVVAAYKGLAKEKEALDISLKALNQGEKSNSQGDENVAALALSLSTLTTEKSRMEEAFQTDKKVTREKYENMIAALREETKNLIQQHALEVNNLKAKISYEIQEREKERADYAAMMKELHLKLNSERITKENLEDKVGINTDSQASQSELEKKVRDLSSSLEAAQRRLQRAEARTVETPALLVRLQQKLALVEQSHSIAIREEQIKVKRAEESARKQCARQEDRVASLEGKIAELSQTIGEYEIRRRQDTNTIKQLQDSLNAKILDNNSNAQNQSDSERIHKRDMRALTDYEKMTEEEYIHALVEKIQLLQKELKAENEKLGNPLDLSIIFRSEDNDPHRKCREILENLAMEYQKYKVKHPPTQSNETDTKIMSLEQVIQDQKNEISILTEKIENFKMMFEEEKHDKAASQKLLEEKLKNEKAYHEDVANGLKQRVQSLEKQVEIQRDRYATLLDETDNYIRVRNEKFRKLSLEGQGIISNVTSPPHMLHYAHELARKDLDITQLRKEKHVLEGQFRDYQREATIEREKNRETIKNLKEKIDRLTRIQSREGANLEYLKNVVMAYLMTTNDSGRKHMLNAIAAVLNFTANEKRLVLTTLS